MKKLIALFFATLLTFLVLATCCCTVLGYVQDFIHFSGIGSELMFLTCTFTLGILGVAWIANERREIRRDRQFRMETSFNPYKFRANLAGTSHSYSQDIEVQADRWEEQERLKRYLNGQ